MMRWTMADRIPLEIFYIKVAQKLNGSATPTMARKYGDQSFKEGEKDNIADELTDILWVLLCIANQTGVDLTKSFKDNLVKKTQRDNKRHISNHKLNSNKDEQ